MDEREFLASRHREVVTEFIAAMQGGLPCGMGDLERNTLGVALRQEVETRLAPELLDPTGYEALEESLGLRPGESAASRAFTDCLWSMAPGIPSSRSVT